MGWADDSRGIAAETYTPVDSEPDEIGAGNQSGWVRNNPLSDDDLRALWAGLDHSIADLGDLTPSEDQLANLRTDAANNGWGSVRDWFAAHSVSSSYVPPGPARLASVVDEDFVGNGPGTKVPDNYPLGTAGVAPPITDTRPWTAILRLTPEQRASDPVGDNNTPLSDAELRALWAGLDHSIADLGDLTPSEDQLANLRTDAANRGWASVRVWFAAHSPKVRSPNAVTVTDNGPTIATIVIVVGIALVALAVHKYG